MPSVIVLPRIFLKPRGLENRLCLAGRKQILRKIQQLAYTTQKPILVSHDDTISEKTKPSSQAKRPIEETAFHHSHLNNKKLWGHQTILLPQFFPGLK
ncbi:hypothetical protein [Sporomusa silvacetica]|uniref:hypothetical protein n=1 Tax=Sporomusa silvacetica TaxID=55504 RepID=UPI001181B20D|nr:hypothetical protein [Sporomusa silvacetica]